MTADTRPTDRLRAALTVVADGHVPDPDAWSRIHDRVEAGSAPRVIDVLPDRKPRARHRLLVAAAVVVALAALAAATLVDRGDDGAKVTTTSPEDAPTGWYVPVDLPDGWTVTSVSSSRADDACPCRDAVWANADRTEVVTAHYADAPAVEGETLGVDPSDTVTFDLPQGVTATRYGPFDSGNPVDATDDWSVEWESDGRLTSFQAIGIPVDAAEPIARALFADPDTDDLPGTDLPLVDQWIERGQIGANVKVDVTMEAPSGNPVDYSLEAPRSAVPIAWSHQPADRLPGQPLETLVMASGGPRPDGSDLPDTPVIHTYLGRWPGATVRTGGLRSIEAGSDEVTPTDAEVEALMASLRPATAAEWRRFVGQAGNRDRAVTASATLAGLIAGVTSPIPTTTTTTGADGLVGDVGDLELTLAAEPRLASWEDAGATLTVRNPTSTTITDPSCALDQAEIALLPADDATRAAVDAIPAGDPWWPATGPCDGGVTIEPGASKTLRLVIRAQFHDSRYGPLPSGNYEATVRIAGADRFASPAPAPVTIGGAACSSGAEDYIGLTEPEARTLAGERLINQIRVPEPGPDSAVANDGERCDRINLVLGDDGLVTFARAY